MGGGCLVVVVLVVGVVFVLFLFGLCVCWVVLVGC